MNTRRRSKPHTFEENIAAEKVKLIAQLAKEKSSGDREALEEKIRQLDTALTMNEWLRTPGRPQVS